MTRFHLGRQINAEQRAFLEEHGYLHFSRVATKEEVAMLGAELERVEERLLAEGRREVNGIPLFFGRGVRGEPRIQRMAFASQFSTAIRAFLRDPRFAPLFSLAGDGARLAEREKDGAVFNRYLNAKGSGYRRVGWHTDGLRDLFYLRMPGPMLNVGLHLDLCRRENGGLRLIPGSHKQGFWSMCFRKPYFIWHRPDPEEIAVETEPGDLTIHDGRLWHRVACSQYQGAPSQRRTLYIPCLVGEEQPKDARSKTPLYHTLGRWARKLTAALAGLTALIFSLSACGETVHDPHVPLKSVAVGRGALAGTFAVEVVTANKVSVPIPLVPDQTGGGINYLLSVRTYDPGNDVYATTTRLCGGENFSVLGETLEIPDATWSLVPESHEVLAVDHETGLLEWREHVQLWGLHNLSEPATSPIPKTQAAAARAESAALIYDMDRDGKPGITLHAHGFVSGDVYAVQRKVVALNGVILGPDRSAGLSVAKKENLVLGATNSRLNDNTDRTKPDPDPWASWYADVRIADGASCDEVLGAKDDGRLPKNRPW